MSTNDTLITTQGQMLDDICYQYYGKTAGVVEAVLDYNRGLADLGPRLPAGIRIQLPVLDVAPEKTNLSLWD